MAIRSSLFALVATACLAASYPASALLTVIEYETDPNLAFCLDDNTCGTKVSLSGKFTANISTTSDPEHPTIEFTNVHITLKDLAGSTIQEASGESSVVLNNAFTVTDRFNFRANATGDNIIAHFLIQPTHENGQNGQLAGLDTGGHLPLQPRVTEIITDMPHPAIRILPEIASGEPDAGFFSVKISVPEPSSLVAMVSAMGLLGLVGWRRKSK